MPIFNFIQNKEKSIFIFSFSVSNVKLFKKQGLNNVKTKDNTQKKDRIHSVDIERCQKVF